MFERINVNIANDDVKDTSVFNYKFDEANKYPLIVIGRGSYIGGAIVDSTITVSKKDFDEGVHNIHIGQFCSLSYNLYFTINRNHDHKSVTMAGSLLIKRNEQCRIKKKGQILIQNDVWIGHSCQIMNGVTIHNGAVVAANSNVVSDVPPYAIVGGNPASVIGYRFKKDIIDKLLKIRWWDWSNEKIVENNRWFNENITAFCNEFYKEAIVEREKIEKIEIPKFNNTFLLFIDFDDEYCLWDKVIQEFISEFRNSSEHSLIVYIDKEMADKQTEVIKDFNEYIDKLISVNIAICNISICIDEREKEEGIFKSVNYYISNRSKDTIRHSCYASYNNVKIISGVDIPIFSDVSKMQESTVVKSNRVYKKYLAIGNSITKHSSCEYWWGEWGMAASKREKDYVNLIAKELSKYEVDFEYNSLNFAEWESSTSRNDQLVKLDKYLEADTDLITIMLGENVDNINELQENMITLIDYVKSKSPKAELIMIGMFWSDKIKDEIKKKVAEVVQIPFIELASKYDNDYFHSKIGSSVGEDIGEEKHKIDNVFVARHPGDTGMRAIANEILACIGYY